MVLGGGMWCLGMGLVPSDRGSKKLACLSHQARAQGEICGLKAAPRLTVLAPFSRISSLQNCKK